MTYLNIREDLKRYFDDDGAVLPATLVDADSNEYRVMVTSVTETEDGYKVTGKLVDQDAGTDND